jgi:hypothetical protein
VSLSLDGGGGEAESRLSRGAGGGRAGLRALVPRLVSSLKQPPHYPTVTHYPHPQTQPPDQRRQRRPPAPVGDGKMILAGGGGLRNTHTALSDKNSSSSNKTNETSTAQHSTKSFFRFRFRFHCRTGTARAHPHPPETRERRRRSCWFSHHITHSLPWQRPRVNNQQQQVGWLVETDVPPQPPPTASSKQQAASSKSVKIPSGKKTKHTWLKHAGRCGRAYYSIAAIACARESVVWPMTLPLYCLHREASSVRDTRDHEAQRLVGWLVLDSRGKQPCLETHLRIPDSRYLQLPMIR